MECKAGAEGHNGGGVNERAKVQKTTLFIHILNDNVQKRHIHISYVMQQVLCCLMSNKFECHIVC